MSLRNQLRRWGAPLKRAVGGMLAKALVELATDDTDLQLVKITAFGETHSEVERIQNFGFTSRPTKGAQAIVAFVGGNRSIPVVIACDDGRTRVKLEEGEVAVYNDQGTKIVLKADNTVEVTCTELKVNGKITATGNIETTGTVKGTTDVVAGVGISLKTHVHSGVTTGAGASGPPVGA